MIDNPAPARLSVYDDDFDPAIGRRVRVFLDGVEINRVEAYDTAAGTVTRAKVDAHGDLVIANDEFVSETLTGHVEATWRAEVGR